MFLALEWEESTRGAPFTLVWLGTVAWAWWVCTRAGFSTDHGDEPPWRRGPSASRHVAVLGVGLLFSACLVLVIGVLGTDGAAVEAYGLFCGPGLVTFFSARGIAGHRMGDRRSHAARVLQRMLWGALVFVSVLVLVRIA